MLDERGYQAKTCLQTGLGDSAVASDEIQAGWVSCR